MAGVVLDPVNSVEDIDRNLKRLNEAIVAMQGGSIAMENIVGYENLATKDNLADEVKQLEERYDYKVGDVYISIDKENPKEKLGYGEWELISQGRALTGVDTKFLSDGSIDPNYDADDDFKNPQQTGGVKEVKLTVDQMPSHKHDWESYTVNADGGAYATGMFTHLSRWGNIKQKPTESAGGDQSHPIMQPYFTAYIWRRTV